MARVVNQGSYGSNFLQFRKPEFHEFGICLVMWFWILDTCFFDRTWYVTLSFYVASLWMLSRCPGCCGPFSCGFSGPFVVAQCFCGAHSLSVVLGFVVGSGSRILFLLLYLKPVRIHVLRPLGSTTTVCRAFGLF